MIFDGGVSNVSAGGRQAAGRAAREPQELRSEHRLTQLCSKMHH